MPNIASITCIIVQYNIHSIHTPYSFKKCLRYNINIIWFIGTSIIPIAYVIRSKIEFAIKISVYRNLRYSCYSGTSRRIIESLWCVECWWNYKRFVSVIKFKLFDRTHKYVSWLLIRYRNTWILNWFFFISLNVMKKCIIKRLLFYLFLHIRMLVIQTKNGINQNLKEYSSTLK